MRKKPLFYEVKSLRFQGLFVRAVSVTYLNPSTELGWQKYLLVANALYP